MPKPYCDRNKIIPLALFACVFSGLPLVAQSTGPNAPIWRQQVLPDLGHNRHATFDTNRAGVTFLNNEKLIVYGVALNTGQLSSRKSLDISSPFRLNVWLLDAKSGALVLTKDFGTRVHDSGVQVTTGGVLVKTGEVVKLYSPDFTEVQDLAMPLDQGAWMITSVSPTGKTILVNRVNQHLNLSQFDVFEADTLKIRQSWRQSP